VNTYLEIAKEHFPVTDKTCVLPIKRPKVTIPILRHDWFMREQEYELLILSKYQSNWLLNNWYHFLRWIGGISGIKKIEAMGQFGIWVEKNPIFSKITIDTHQHLDAAGQPFMGYNKEKDILAVYEPGKL
jgi:hypothetical protein